MRNQLSKLQDEKSPAALTIRANANENALPFPAALGTIEARSMFAKRLL
jgi:hypothetical protein